ncbi:MAG: sensor histidine kinase [Bacteroidales bacterium]
MSPQGNICLFAVLLMVLVVAVLIFVCVRAKLQNQKLKSALNAKDDYISMLVHDIKNPIMTIKTTIELLKLKEEVPNEKFLNIIDDSSSLLQDIVNDTSTLALETQLQNFGKKELVDVESVISVSMQYSNYLAKTKSINVSYESMLSDSALFKTNRSLLIIALRNIVGNAVKFSSPGDIVKILTSLEGQELTIKVCDMGQGMAEDKIDAVLKGRKVESHVGTAGEAGSGIGLVNSVKIIKMLGGRVEITSLLDQGTEVSIWFLVSSLS